MSVCSVVVTTLRLRRKKGRDHLSYNGTTQTSVFRVEKFTGAYPLYQSQTQVSSPAPKADRCPVWKGQLCLSRKQSCCSGPCPSQGGGGQPAYNDCRPSLPIKPCAAVLMEFHTYCLNFTYVYNTASGGWGLLPEIM